MTLRTAVADVIDNSIEARASRIAVEVHFNGDDSSVTIADNGHGMTPAQIREALRYGADREYDARDALGQVRAGVEDCIDEPVPAPDGREPLKWDAG